MPVFSLMNDAHASAHGSPALSPAQRREENRRGMDSTSRAVCTGQVPALLLGQLMRVPCQRPGPHRRPAAAISGVWRVGGWSLPAEQLPLHMPSALAASSPGGDRTRPGLRGGAGSVGGQGREEAGRGTRGTQGRPELTLFGGGGGRRESDRATDRWKQLDSWRRGDQHAEGGRERQGKRRERRQEREASLCSLPPDALLCPREAAGGTEWHSERDVGTEDVKDPALLVGLSGRRTDRPTRGAARRAERGTRSSRAARLNDRRPDRQRCWDPLPDRQEAGAPWCSAASRAKKAAAAPLERILRSKV